MATVFLSERPAVLETWLERRRQLGQDRFDEVWEGDYHVVPGPSMEHGLVDSRLGRLLAPRAQRAGLAVTTQFNLGGPSDYRVPDGGLHRSPSTGVYVDTAAMVIEVMSPGDETMAKLGFYARHGVAEVLVADPTSQTVRLWQLADPSRYTETGRSDLLDVTTATLATELGWSARA